ncbi:uncharacterized protein LOC122502170 [Leptopilina heterotoma]|uniref:uncharacterized protein LOC122502170 n=1 Tax=Leptopilina heterotoma TaxID=63436 RepID=UPI001CA9215E|nr:uncharacterized protein LOC122502170 [Leptopilina heterotoma]
MSCTSSEEMDCLELGDTCVEVTDAVLERTATKKDSPNAPVRYIISNLKDKKLRLVVWRDLHAQYEGKLPNKIIKISRGKVLPANPAFFRLEQGLMPIEIAIQNHTIIEILSDLPKEPTEKYCPIPFKDVYCSIGKHVNIAGFIKMQVESIVFNNSSYGSGTITDVHYKLLVNVTQFNKEFSPAKGKFVKLNGLLRKNEHGTAILQIASMNDIREVPDAPEATEVELKKGFANPPKASSPSQTSNGDPQAQKSNGSSSAQSHSPLQVQLDSSTAQSLPQAQMSQNSSPLKSPEELPNVSKRFVGSKEDFPKLPPPKKSKMPE